MYTPYFPALRSRLAALGRRTARTLRQLLPAPLLSATVKVSVNDDVHHSNLLNDQNMPLTLTHTL